MLIAPLRAFIAKHRNASRQTPRRTPAHWVGIEALERRALLSSVTFIDSVFTPLTGKPAIVVGPGGADGQSPLDLNGDGLNDTIVQYTSRPHLGSNTDISVSALLTQPNGTAIEVNIFKRAAPAALIQVVAGDINNDGLPDIFVQWTATASASSARSIDVFIAQPNGTFTVGPIINPGISSNNPVMSVFDMTGDGHNDLFLQTLGKISVYRGGGNATLQTPVTTNLPSNTITGIEFQSDLDGDNIKDIVVSGVTSMGSLFLNVYKGLATGGYNGTATFSDTTNNLTFSALRQLSDDARPDIVAYNASLFAIGQPTTMYVFRNNGNAGFTQTFKSDTYPTGFYGLNVGGVPLMPLESPDLDGDGDNDLIFLEGSGLSPTVIAHVVRNNGNGVFAESQAITISDFASTGFVYTRDIDRDGKLDLVADQLPVGQSWSIKAFFNNGNATYDTTNALSIVPANVASQRGVVANFDNDPKLDVLFVTLSSTQPTSNTFINTTGRVFNLVTAPIVSNDIVNPSITLAPAPLDFDDDGDLDLIGYVGDAGTNAYRFEIFSGDGDGTFTSLGKSVSNSTGTTWEQTPKVVNLNNDGKPDLIFLGQTSSSQVWGGVVMAISGLIPPTDTAGNDVNNQRDLGTLTSRISLVEYVNNAVGADARDSQDFYRFTLTAPATVRVTATPETHTVQLSLQNVNAIGTYGNSFPPNAQTPAVVTASLAAGTYNIRVGNTGSTYYRLSVEIPTAVPIIDVTHLSDRLPTDQSVTIDYGSVLVSATDTTNITAYRVRNTGTGTLNLAAVTLPAGYVFGADTLVASLAAGASDTFTVLLDTTTPGTYAGNIVVASTDNGVASFLIPVTGVVEAPPVPPQNAVMVVKIGDTTLTSSQPTAISFGSLTQNGSVGTVTFTVYNTGNENLTLGTPVLPSNYTLTNALSTSIAPGENDSFSVSLGTAFNGTFPGNITFTNNSGGSGNTFVIPVTGTVSAAPVFLPDLTGEIQQVLVGKTVLTNGDVIIPGDKVTAMLRVFNAGIGELNADLTRITFYLTTNFVLDDGDIEIQTFDFKKPKITGGLLKDLKYTLVIPGNVPAGNYRLVADLDSSDLIAESGENNNSAFSGTLLTAALQIGTVGGRSNVKLALTDSDGTLVTFALTGGGTGTITYNAGTNSYDLDVTGTNSRSSLTITTKGGDNQVNLRDVSITNTAQQGLGKIVAKTANLIGSLTAPDGVLSVTLNDITDATMDLGAPAGVSNATTALIAQLIKNSTITSELPYKSFAAALWQDDDSTPDVLTTPALGAIKISGSKTLSLPGDFEADITGPNDTGANLSGAKIPGSVSGATWDLAGIVGAITISGNAGAASKPLTINAPAIKTFTVNGNAQDLSLNLTQAYDPNNTKLQNISKLTIKGTANAFRFTSLGSVGAIATGAMTGSDIFIGTPSNTVNLPDAQNDFVTVPGATLAKVTVAGGFASSNIAAVNITSAVLPAVTTNNASTPFGLASTGIKAATIGGVKALDADKSGSIESITDGDFVVRIV